MLIRSQDKEMIVNVDAINHILVDEAYRLNGSLYDVCADGMRLGYYSTKAKAMKVLDMIQKAYADFESAKITSTGLVTVVYTGSYDTPDSVVDCKIKALKGYVEMIRESVVFQIPEDSEVEE